MPISDKPGPFDALQEYLSLVHDAGRSRDAKGRDIRLLRAWGVIRYIQFGPVECEHCGVEVRLAIPMTSERLNGEQVQFSCLCTHCTFLELKRAKRIVMQVGSARVEYPHEDALSR